MLKHCSMLRVAAPLLMILTFAGEADATSAFTGATEFTQIMNNSELVSLVGQSSTQITNQMTQITNQVSQIENQLKIYQNMLQNTLTLPDNIWGQATQDLSKLQSIMQQGQSIAYSMGNIDSTLKSRFQSYSDFQANLPNATNFSDTYKTWSETNRDTIRATLKAAHLTADQFSTEQSTVQQLQAQSQSAVGQMQALQVGHEIAAQQVQQMQKLRGLVSQQTTMMGTWYQSQQTDQDEAKAAEDKFFSGSQVNVTGTPFNAEW